MKILIATTNEGKIAEFRSLLFDERLEFIGLDAFSDIPDIEETGNTFAENAKLKAVSYSSYFGLHTLADDSGLEVEALNGRPGVFSARYGGVNIDYAAKIRLLLDEINAAEKRSRTASFISHIVFASPDGDVLFEAEGVCEGSIALEPKGSNGFGYDPVFIPDGFDQTFGELSDDVKQKVSHRAHAIAKIMRYLRDFA